MATSQVTLAMATSQVTLVMATSQVTLAIATSQVTLAIATSQVTLAIATSQIILATIIDLVEANLTAISHRLNHPNHQQSHHLETNLEEDEKFSSKI